MSVRNLFVLGAAAAVVGGASIAFADPTPILAPGNPIRAFDSDIATGSSSYPSPNETPPMAIDGSTATKYLNFGNTGSGFIVIPSGPSIVQSFQLTTANDAPERDPFSFNLYGTNAPIVSADNSNGLAEPWTLIGSGPLSPPPSGSFMTPYTPTDVANSTIYSAYKLIFPTLRGSPAGICCMQFSEVQFYNGPGATGGPILAPGNNIRAVDDPLGASQSSYPTGEEPDKSIDQLVATKYLNFGREHSGVIVTPSVMAVVDGIQFTTANDFPSRDPAIITVYGTNDPITSPDNGFGNSENWTVIVANLPYASPTGRGAVGPLVSFPNGTAWTSYKIEVVDNVGPDTGTGGANSVQFAEVQLFSGAVPEPSVALLAIGGAVALVARRRRS
ncbi:MAG TPA: hypothetical protein VGP99_05325 [Tepidisphaeraceae bacterium]|nr:hypothetical protein [Tepidisphaeraceae bacterium]